MNLLLTVVYLIFTNVVSATTINPTITVNSLCSDGSMALLNDNVVAVPLAYIISSDLKTLTLLLDEDSQNISDIAFTLTPYGKNTYLAIVLDQKMPYQEFFITLDAQTRSAQIFTRDNGGKHCGGGIITTAVSSYIEDDSLLLKGG